MDRQCKRCHEVKPREDFGKAKNYPGGIHYYCKSCANAATKASVQKRKDLVTEFKNQPCADCSRSYPSYVMDCDHLPQHEKEADISWLVHRGTIEGVRQELKKCEPVCANCHRERTQRRLRART